MRVLQGPNASRYVARVDVSESCPARDVSSANEHRWRRVRRIGQPVILMERGDVPGNLGRDAGDKFGQACQLRFAVVEAGDEQRDDFHPHTRAVQPFDRVEDWL
jgi:hypothetical protein